MDTLQSCLRRFSQGRILCIGDLMLDTFVYGSARRLSPEAPIPVLHAQREQKALGGCGNVVHNVKTLGGTPICIALTGDDRYRQDILTLFSDLDVSSSHLLRTSSLPTTVKVRFFAQDQQLLRVDHEIVTPIETSLKNHLLHTAKELIPSSHAIVLSDYGKGVLTESTCQALIAAAGSCPIIVDPKGQDYRKYKGATLITPNRKELEEATRLPCITDDEVVAAARTIIHQGICTSLLVTRSEKGMSLITQDTATHIPVNVREVYDVSGAGDTVIATIALALGTGSSAIDAAYLANLAGSIVVGKVGTAPIHCTELENRLHNREEISKCFSLASAVEQVERWKRKGYKVGFTNGCFDLLHPGHLHILQNARRHCDRLIVGVNTDTSVQGLKGPSRPIQQQDIRCSMLEALSCVDGIILFDDPTPLTLIHALTPHVLIKGADYAVKDIVGSEYVLQKGGDVVRVPLKEGFSTTSLIKRLHR